MNIRFFRPVPLIWMLFLTSCGTNFQDNQTISQPTNIDSETQELKSPTEIMINPTGIVVDNNGTSLDINPQIPSIAFIDGECNYSGPDEFNKEFTLNWSSDHSIRSGFIIEVFSISTDRSINDLLDMPAVDPLPSWITRLSYDIAQNPGEYSKSINLGYNASYKGESIYFVCFSADEENALNAFGPFKINE